MPDSLLFLQDLAVILLSASAAGYICRKIGLSPVVGYITAGLIVGTPEIVFPYVTDESRIATIAQLGVVFLMFSIGLQFHTQRIREIGMRVILSAALTSLFIFSAVRLSSQILGLSAAAGIALAAVFMNSSSAIISKIIQETGISYERHGQIALTTTLLEDIVSVVMLAVLGSYIVIGGGVSMSGPKETIELLFGFAFLAFIVGSFLFPKLIRKAFKSRSAEAVSVLTAGVLILASLIAANAGFSIALGAFLCGMVAARTRERFFIERSFQGLKDIFLTVFFVTIGMMVNVHAFPGAVKWILLGTLGALMGRALASFVSLVLTGEHPQTALSAAFCLTPLGEFSFIIAAIAVAGGLFSETFQTAVVGTVLATSIITPLIASNSARLTRFISKGKLPFIDRVHSSYREFWAIFLKKRASAEIWQKLRKLIFQTAVSLLLISTLLIFSGKFFERLRILYPEIFNRILSETIFWTAVGIICIIPVIAVWRNLSAAALILAEYIYKGQKRAPRRVSVLNRLFRFLFFLILLIWVWNILPPELPRQIILVSTVIFAVSLLYFFWRDFIKTYSDIEWLLNQNLNESGHAPLKNLFDNWKEEEWDLNIKEFTLPDDSPSAGMRLKTVAFREKTGCSVIGIQRHGYSLLKIGADTQIFPGDELLLLGSDKQINAAQKMLSAYENFKAPSAKLESHVLKSFKLSADSATVNKKLSELNWPRSFGVQVIALMRGGVTVMDIDSNTLLKPDDTLLLLGTPRSIEFLAEKISTSL